MKDRQTGRKRQRKGGKEEGIQTGRGGKRWGGGGGEVSKRGRKGNGD